MDDDDNGKDAQTRRVMRDLHDTTTDYAHRYLPIPMDYVTFMRSDATLAGVFLLMLLSGMVA